MYFHTKLHFCLTVQMLICLYKTVVLCIKRLNAFSASIPLRPTWLCLLSHTTYCKYSIGPDRYVWQVLQWLALQTTSTDQLYLYILLTLVLPNTQDRAFTGWQYMFIEMFMCMALALLRVELRTALTKGHPNERTQSIYIPLPKWQREKIERSTTRNGNQQITIPSPFYGRCLFHKQELTSQEKVANVQIRKL